MTREEALEFVDCAPLVFLDPDYFDQAIVGVSSDSGLVVYSIELCIQALMSGEGWTEEEANDWFWFNTAGSHIAGGPVFIHTTL